MPLHRVVTWQNDTLVLLLTCKQYVSLGFRPNFGGLDAGLLVVDTRVHCFDFLLIQINKESKQRTPVSTPMDELPEPMKGSSQYGVSGTHLPMQTFFMANKYSVLNYNSNSHV